MLGEGGMGQVLLAEDTRLKRRVALKVLPEELAADPSRLGRLQREAEAVAALNHPNIVTLHSIEESGDTRFLTVELVEGQSLDKLIPPGGLPLAQVFDIGIAMADALAAAHEKGIVHRTGATCRTIALLADPPRPATPPRLKRSKNPMAIS
jgi:serine/threonine-protein kinase